MCFLQALPNCKFHTMKSEKISVQIPIKRYLKNYLVSLTNSKGEKITIDAKSDFCLLFYSMIEVGNGVPAAHVPSDSLLTIEAPLRDKLGKVFDCRHVGPTINRTNIERFNRFLDTLMRKELYDRLDLIEERGENKRKSGRMKAEIMSFLEKYQIDHQDLSYETLIKDYYRKKKRGESVMKKIIQING